MYYVMRASAPSLHRESTDSLIYICIYMYIYVTVYGKRVHLTQNYNSAYRQKTAYRIITGLFLNYVATVTT